MSNTSPAAARPPATPDATAADAPPPRKQRHDGWSRDRQVAFLQSLLRTRSVVKAIRAVGLSRASAYQLRRRFPPFADAWDRILAIPDASGLARGNSGRRQVDKLVTVTRQPDEVDMRRRADPADFVGLRGGEVDEADNPRVFRDCVNRVNFPAAPPPARSRPARRRVPGGSASDRPW